MKQTNLCSTVKYTCIGNVDHDNYYNFMMMIITGHNEVVAKVMFSHVSVILLTGGGLWADPPGPGRPPRQGEPPRDQADTPQTRQTPPSRENPPGTRQTPHPPRPGRHPPGRTPLQTPPPDQADTTPPAGRPPPEQADPLPGRRLQHTVNERPVRILLECILVFGLFSFVCAI